MFPLKDNIPTRSFPLINWVLIALNVVVFMGELSAQAHGQVEQLIYEYGVIPARFLSDPGPREFITLITCMFLHGGWFHLISNMWALFIFGDNIEDRMGPGRYLVFYLLCGIVAGLTQIFVNSQSTMPSVGASGAIAGVLGAYLLLFPHARVITLIPVFFLPLFFEIPAVFYLGFWFLAQLFSGTLQIVQTVYSPEVRQAGGVAFWAHAGGFIAGALLVRPFTAPSQPVRRRYADQYAPW